MFSAILVKIQTYLLNKMYLKVSTVLLKPQWIKSLAAADALALQNFNIEHDGVPKTSWP